MHTVKRIVSLLLCVVLLAAFLPYAHAAEKKPVVFVAGYTSARLYMDRGTPNEKRVWKQDIAGKILDAVKSELPKIALEAAPTAVGIFDPLFDTLEPYVNELIEPLRMNDDGSSKYAVEVYPHAVADTRLDRLREIGYYPDHDSLVALGKAAGEKNVYCCTLDWRLGQVDNAAVLDAYIRDVLQKTGAEKVDLMGVSYGGQVCGSYLSLYGGNSVERVVLQCPALDGSSIVPQLLSGDDFTIAWEDLLELVRAFKKDEKAYGALSTLVPNAFLCRFLRAFLDRFLIDFFNNFGSVWDLVPREEYPALREKLLRDGSHDEMIRKSDVWHNEVAANMTQTLRTLQAEGVDTAIVAGYGWALAVDNGHTSDGVIDTVSMTGAECAPLGKTLSSDKQQSTTVSADGTVDAKNAYL
ncbi:MAG: alpha/beta hydrolase, partial [Clostridia bacterium]|nr:alpha/beta hydrolase [Clostridia bacterium]